MSCLCSNDDYRIVYHLNDPAQAKIVKCLSCGLYRTLPAPVNGKLKVSNYTIAVENEEEYAKKRRYTRQKEIISIVKEYTTLTSKINILDAGCSVGYFVRYARDNGLKCFGSDIDNNAVDYAHCGLNLNCLCVADATALPFGKDKFDVVILHQVLEHLPDPIKALDQIRGVLKRGGLLFISTPHHRGLIAKVRPLSWPGWAPCDHYWHFTPKIIDGLLNKHRFKIIYLKLTRIYTPLISSMMKRIAYHMISRFGCVTGLGDEIFLISRKEI